MSRTNGASLSHPIVLNDMHDEYTLVLKYVPNYLPSYFIHTALNLIGFFYVKEMNTHQTFHWIHFLQNILSFAQKNGPNNFDCCMYKVTK